MPDTYLASAGMNNIKSLFKLSANKQQAKHCYSQTLSNDPEAPNIKMQAISCTEISGPA